MRDFADLRLQHLTEGGQRAPKLWLSQAEQKIRLIFARIDPFPQNSAVRMMLDDRIMASRDIIAVERLGFAPEIAELEFFIAHHAGIRCPAK